ncbi:hypothetical protein TCAL_09642 [Tigriopus californicus]|uniref:Thioredoxin domain-containing protein n=1 Tax=Tigriopus californicus TaxID=6832 RepID=A0A553NX32_TIGCA|nr:hypothetical protein TCAL_09642 [Tigriopus californicus]
MHLKAVILGVWLCQTIVTNDAQYSNAQLDQDHLSVLDSPSELERLVFNVYNARHWLLLFHHDHCNKCVYESIQAIAFAKWIQDLGLDPPLHLGVISCSKNEDQWRESASFKKYCDPSLRKEDRMFLIKPQSQSLESDAVPLPNSHLKHLERLQNAIGRQLAGNWTSLGDQELLSSMTDSSKSEILLDWPNDNINDEVLLVAEMDLNRKRIWIHRRTDVKSTYDERLNFVQDPNGSNPRLRSNLDNTDVCDAWRPNWLLNILSSFLCPKSDPSDCDIERDLFPTLDLMSAKKETFSVRGFESKFKDICQSIQVEKEEDSSGDATRIDDQDVQLKRYNLVEVAGEICELDNNFGSNRSKFISEAEQLHKRPGRDCHRSAKNDNINNNNDHCHHNNNHHDHHNNNSNN